MAKHKWLVIALWAIVILASVPAVTHYTNYISYSTSTPALSKTESARAQALLAQANPQNESLILVVAEPKNMSQAELANLTLQFQNALGQAKIQNYTKSVSAFSEYASFIDNIVGNRTQLVRQAYSNFTRATSSVYGFPALFLAMWAKTNYTSVAQALKMANYSNTPYEQYFTVALNYTLQKHPHAPPQLIVQNATIAAVALNGTKNPYEFAALRYLNVTDYEHTLEGFSMLFNQTVTPVSSKLLWAILRPGDPGVNYVTSYGLQGAPSFILKQFVNPNSTVYLVYIYFGVPSGYVGKGDTTPSESATPTIRDIAAKYFGQNAQLTGDGAIAYDTQKLTAGAGIVFAFTFVFLAIAVALTLRSYIAPLVALLMVSVATLLGYVSIFITGVLLFHVNFIVNYTLTAVLLGVSADYLVFILYRYLQELREGVEPNQALKTATSRSGRAVLVSGLTVAASLGTFAFTEGLRSWGPVLFMGVIFTVISELTLLPAIAAVIGPRMFTKGALKADREGYRRSAFYRAAKLSVSRRTLVVALLVVLAAPAIYAWFTIPTSYNFNEGLPSGLPSVRALKTLEQAFGSNLIYPNFIVVNLTGQVYDANGTLTQNALRQLQSYYDLLSNTPGVTTIIGPDPHNTTSTQVLGSFIFDHGKHAYYLFYDDYSPYSSQAISLIKALRANNTILVGGLTSSIIDQQAVNNAVYTELELLIVAAIAIIIGVSFRSIKYPLIALSGVFISITWTTAILYLIVKYIFHQELLYLIPLILFIILMSLGNDYTVFIISRVREAQREEGFTEGIYRGLSGSGIVVTSLGIILAVSLGSLALAPISFLRQLGISFIISLILDTFVIRTLYFPAMIALLREKGPTNVSDQTRKQGQYEKQ